MEPLGITLLVWRKVRDGSDAEWTLLAGALHAPRHLDTLPALLASAFRMTGRPLPATIRWVVPPHPVTSGLTDRQ